MGGFGAIIRNGDGVDALVAIGVPQVAVSNHHLMEASVSEVTTIGFGWF